VSELGGRYTTDHAGRALLKVLAPRLSRGGSHHLAQQIKLAGGEACAFNRDVHRLLLNSGTPGVFFSTRSSLRAG
jgi:hypothetical protein